MKLCIFLICISFPTSFFIQASPNVDRLIDNVINGNLNEAELKMSKLLYDYPNDAGVLFLQALLELNGPQSIEIYKKIYKLHKNNKYADDAIMKIGEYYYASGLYIQAAEWFKKIHMYYRRSDYLETAINMFLQCLIIAGSLDTASSYSQTFNSIFPKVNIDDRINKKLSAIDKVDPIVKSLNNKEEVKDEKVQFSLQVGAYGNRDNAEKAMYNLRSVGYSSRINELVKNKKVLYTVRCGYFDSKEEANKIKKRLRIHLGYEPIIIEN
jgi:tetratricopeptide (TPR) repeat protein